MIRIYKRLLTSILISLAILMPFEVAAETKSPEGKTTRCAELPAITVTVGRQTIRACLAADDPSRIHGLLGWLDIVENEGMLLDFVMEGQYAIHMQGMKFPIDALWIDSQGIIRLIYEEIPPNSGQVYPSMFSARYCLELKGGFCKKHEIKTGQKVKIGQYAR